MTAIGIDLGTTNTVVAAVRDGRATALKDRLGRTLLPSVVSFPESGPPVLGFPAKERRSLDPENTVFSVKRLIGRSWETEQVQKARARFPFALKEGPGKATLVTCRGSDYTLPEISAQVLEAARAIAEERLGESVTDVVITVPANFNDLQRAATKVAARVAGLEVLRILNEPTAAALAYGFGKKGRERIAVYDFGGGTFDVTLLDLSENVFEVLATAGDTFLGGDDIDLAIVDRMAEELYKKHQVDASKNLRVREQLRLEAEKLKIDLSTRSMAKALVTDLGHGTLGRSLAFEFSMRRSDFEALAEPLVNRTLEVCQEAMNIAGLGVKDLDQVLLVGGSTRIPLVRRRISSYFGKMPQSRVNPDEVVAIGAAIQASALEGRGASMASIPSPPEGSGSQRPPGRSQFPSSPGIQTGEGRPNVGSTQTGLAGLRKTAPGTGPVAPAEPSATTRTENSVLAGLPRSPSPTGPRQRVNTLSGLGSNPPGANLEDEGEPRGPRTRMGVGEAAPPLPGAPREKLKTLAGTGDAKDATRSPAAAKFGTLSGVGPDSPGPAPLKRVGSPFERTLAGAAPAPAQPVAPLPPLPIAGIPGERKRVQTIPGVSDSKLTSTSTLARLGGPSDSKVTSHSTLARLGALGAPPAISEKPEAVDLPSVVPSLAPDDFEEVTSIYPDMAETAAKLRDSHVDVEPNEPMFPSGDPPPAPTTDGSVVFDFADLNEEADLPAPVSRANAVESNAAAEVESSEAEEAALPAPARGPREVSILEVLDDLEGAEEVTDLPASIPPVDLPAVKAPSEPPPGLPLVGAGVPTNLARTASGPFAPSKEAPRPGPRDVPAAKSDDDLSISAIDLHALGALDGPPFGATASLESPLAETGAAGLPGRVDPGLPGRAGGTSLPERAAPLPTGLGQTRIGLDRTMAAPERAPLDAPPNRSLLDDLSESVDLPASAGGGVLSVGTAVRTALAGVPEQTLRAPGNLDGGVPSRAPNPAELHAPAPSIDTARVRPPLLLDVTPLSLGVETVGGFTDRLIERNSPIPCERTRTFRTTGHNQTTVVVRVCQGEVNRFAENTVLGEVQLSGITPAASGGAKVDVTFTLDESGMLQVTALDRASGKQAKALLYLVGVQSN